MTDLAKRLHNIDEYYFSTKLAEINLLIKNGKPIINLGIGSPDLPPHPEVIATLQQEAIKQNTHYRGAAQLRKAFAEWYATHYHVILQEETEILPLIGSKEGIVHTCMTYLNEDDEALIPNPGYPTYQSAVQLAGGKCKTYSLLENNHWLPDLDALQEQDLSKVKLFFVNYPHMPTGALVSEGFFEKLIAFAYKNNILIVHDNPYSFIRNENPKSILQIPEAKQVAIELNSLSKSHNMAGWRIGVLCSHETHVSNILRFKSNMDSGMFLPVQMAAAKALSLHQEWYQTQNEIYISREKIVCQLLDILQCTYQPNQQGLFVWAKIPKGFQDGYAFSDFLLYKYDIFITPGGIFGSEGNQYVRVSLCQPENILQETLKRIQHAK
jgi:LL-diaminopimelate aminotransferase